MTDPTSNLEEWAARYRERRRPSPARRRAIRAAVLAGAASQDRRIRRQRWLGLGVVLAAGVLAVLALARLLDGRMLRAGAGDDRSLVPHSAPAGEEHELREGEAVSRPAASDSSPAGPAVAAPVDAVEDGPAAPASPAPVASRPPRGGAERRRVASPAVEPGPVPSAGDELESMRLLRDAEQRLERDAAASLRLLERHAQRFPRSTLALEREALTVIALCRLGRTDAGRERQRELLRSHDGSVYAARVRSACDDAP